MNFSGLWPVVAAALLLAACASAPPPVPTTPTPAPALPDDEAGTPLAESDTDYDIEAALASVPITVNTADFAAECLPPHEDFPSGDYRAFLLNDNYHLDENHTIIQMIEGDWRHNARPLSRLGFAGIRAWCEQQDQLGLQLAVNQAEWLVQHSERVDDFATWRLDYGRGGFLAPAGWTSGLGNGLAVAFLTQLDALATSTTQYGEMATLIANSFAADLSAGGVSGELPDDLGILFQESAHPDAPAPHILNGHLIGLKGLAYYVDHTDDPRARGVLQAAISGTRNSLELFDVDTIAAYALAPIPWSSSRLHYAHDIHINGLFWLYQRTADPAFLEYALRFQHYKWPAIPADLYYDQMTEANLMAREPDSVRHTDSPVGTTALILDLREVQPVRSFGYAAVGPYPVAYTLSVSEDGEDWQPIEQVTGYTETHNTLLLDDVPARYVRLALDEMVDFTNPYYYEISGGFYTERLMWGVIRTDNAAYWETPILLLTEADHIINNTQLLQDGDPETALEIPANATLYGDLRASGQIESITLTARGAAERDLWLEVSADMLTWQPMGEPVTLALSNALSVPAAVQDYQYFRLHLDGTTPLSLTEVTITAR